MQTACLSHIRTNSRARSFHPNDSECPARKPSEWIATVTREMGIYALTPATAHAIHLRDHSDG